MLWKIPPPKLSTTILKFTSFNGKNRERNNLSHTISRSHLSKRKQTCKIMWKKYVFKKCPNNCIMFKRFAWYKYNWDFQHLSLEKLKNQQNKARLMLRSPVMACKGKKYELDAFHVGVNNIYNINSKIIKFMGIYIFFFFKYYNLINFKIDIGTVCT